MIRHRSENPRKPSMADERTAPAVCQPWIVNVALNPNQMIWYILYPLRGTTEPPFLDQKHPLRSAFTRYGNHAARHPVITLLISIATAVILIYPFPFLYTNNFTNGSSNLPHHVWTSAQPVSERGDVRPDVVMRSIWVHGSYMKALQQNVLQTALEIQDELLGPTMNFDPRRPSNQLPPDTPTFDLTTDMRDTLHAINGLSNASWFFHSPLQYWSCSAEEIARDKDVITTINERSRQATSVNVTLRHSIVFSGKRFEDHRLAAADALVITLVHMLDSPVGRQWERKAEQMAYENSSKWRMYPGDGRSLASTLYEFRFQPLSFQDDLFLGVAYTLCTIYFLLRLSKLQALRSRLGLIIAVIAHIAMSMMSSFTICAILKIDLSQMPRETYPLVIVTCGLENIFRLVNAVIMTRSEDSTATRMGEALGRTGHVALAGVVEKLAILWLLARVTYPPITAFCTYAAIAFIFDFFYKLTFFISVLSVDVQRLELNDALSKAYSHTSRLGEGPTKRTWTDALLSGDAPFSTRIAGTIVMIGFVLMAQWHFFENEPFLQTASRLLKVMRSEASFTLPSQTSVLSVDIHQARSPTAWLKLQDHETAHEVIQVIKPHANSYIARVYDPLIFVLDGSDRTPNRSGVRPFLPAAYDFARNQFRMFLVTIIIVVAAVSLFMNYLLWDDNLDSEDSTRPDDDPLISIKTLSRGHTLDVALLTASSEGVIVTVGLDRWIRIWDVRKTTSSYVVYDPETNIDPFPVLAVAIDSDSNWLAILSSKDKVFLWNLPEQRWGPSIDVKIRGRKPAGFFFGYNKDELINPIFVVRQNGLMSELRVEDNKEFRICRSPLVSVHRHLEKPNPSSDSPFLIVTASKTGCVHVVSQVLNSWVSEEVDIPDFNVDNQVVSILPLPTLNSFLAVRNHTVDLIDISTRRVTHTFFTKSIRPNTLQCFHSSRRRPQCGSVGLGSLALAYISAETGHCILQSYLPQREGDTICFRDPASPGSQTCCLWRQTIENRNEIENPGQWKALPSGYLVGVRKQEMASIPHDPSQSKPTANSGLRRRGVNLSLTRSRPQVDMEDQWEVWAISGRGDKYFQPLCEPTEQDHLLVSGLGPMQKMGKRSIAVALGNVVKVITVGHEKFDDEDINNDDVAYVGMTIPRIARKKKATTRRKSTA